MCVGWVGVCISCVWGHENICIYTYMHLARGVAQLAFLISVGELPLLAHRDLPAAWSPVVWVFSGSSLLLGI